ncbi:MAG: isoprenylcysteine carboxylmethyltransferase family protein [Dehalococcoidia bacterium]
MSVSRHLRAIAFLPAMVTLAVPGLLLYITKSAHIGWGLGGAARLAPLALGATLIAGGLALMAWTIGLFAGAGRGTLAPWDPTQRLVVQGPYRHVRNPMISGVLGVLLGETALLGSPPLLAWFGAFVLANALYLPLVEERGLEERFGDDYRLYKRNVPRWVPRLTPWSVSREGAG